MSSQTPAHAESNDSFGGEAGVGIALRMEVVHPPAMPFSAQARMLMTLQEDHKG